MYVEKYIFFRMNCIKLKLVCSICLLVLEIMVGVVVIIVIFLIRGFVLKSIVKGCCLYLVNFGGFEKIRDVIFNICSVYVIYILLCVFIDRFFKLLVIGY